MNKILFILFLLLSHLGFSQLSKKHYIPPLTSAAFGNANPESQYIYISTPNISDITYTIIPVGETPENYITGTVSNTMPDEVFIGSGNGQLFMDSNNTSTITDNKGYIIEANSPIYVSIRMNAGGGSQAGAIVSKGLSALGKTFRVGSFTNQNPQDNYLNFVSIMATEDNTKISFDLENELVIKNYTQQITRLNITLNEGESYIMATNSSDDVRNRDGLIGTQITSDKPIVVNCGSTNGSFDNGEGRDYGIDQIVGLSKVGREYILVKGGGNNNWENVLIVAHSNNTTISINGNTTTTINAGDYYLIEGNQYNTAGNMYVETSEDVFVYQGVGATNSEANQGMFFVPPLSCEARGNLDNIANINDIGNTKYTGGITVVTKKGATVTINNTPIANFSTIGPSNVNGKTDYVTYKVTGLNGNISVESTDELYCAYFNFNGAATSGSFYSGFPSAPEINFDTTFNTLGNCIPNITLTAANTQLFDSFEWWFNDGSGYINLNVSTDSYAPTNPGKYKLIGIITCTLQKLESTEIPISICPDDIDNDGIIDNIDLDNDNDGILNCTESKGNVIIDIADTNNPNFIFQDASTSNSLATTQITKNTSTNSFTGTTTGEFTSIVQPDSNGENDYAITFTEAINIKLSENTTIAHTITDGELFIAKITPANKNITLVDPDNRLLIDSNFDGIFETGVSQISGSEIHFKINPNANGTTPYSFLANKVTGFSFTHKLVNTSNASTYTGNISLTCYKLDSDNDGVLDELDLDSDNDGIPDSIEHTGVLISLSGNDDNADGVDDVFNTTPTLLDSDLDGVLNHLDLDSDNDGIFDLVETGQLGLLSDTDLNGIEDGASFGSNGLSDNIETTPDSNVINYTLENTDGDNFFNFIDADSDGDNCNDVIEAGFSDMNQDSFLGDNTPTINSNGVVNNTSDGYTTPNPNYITDGTITINTQPANTIACENSNTKISIEYTPISNVQWEISIDNGINWTIITNNIIYSGATTNILSITKTPLSYNNYLYRAFLNRTDNSCGIYSNEIKLTVNPLPVVNTNVTLVQCDDDTDGFSPFNLKEAQDNISTNVANETFTYYTSQAAAITGDITSADYINNPTTFINRTIPSDIVWANIKSSDGCSVISQIQLNVSTTQIPPNFQRSFYACDDFLDMNGDNNNNDRDGIASFNFSSVTNDVLNLFPVPARPNLSIHYYKNEIDALAEENEIADISNYRNIGYPNSQQIYIRVDNGISNDCLGLGAHITLTVEALPIANPVTIPRQCDDNHDGLFSFNTSNIESTVLLNQNPADITVTYFDEDKNLLPSPLPNPFLTKSQAITIRVTNNITSTNPSVPCYDETTLEFIVDKLPIANLVDPIIVCDGSSEDIDDDNIFPFNTSTIENTVLGLQTGMEIFYDYVDENGNTIINSTTLPNPLISASQIIIASVVNPINRTCTASTNIELTVNPLPEFSVDSPQIVCSSDPNFSIILDPIENNTTEVFNYKWEWTNLNGTITKELLPDTSPTLTVSTPGTYHVTLTKTDGSLCPKTKAIFVNASEKATITLEDIEIEGLSDSNKITINDTNNNLGLGAYEYALEDEFSTLSNEAFFNYQDSPIFKNVFPGIYKLYVRDKNGCGASEITVNVIGFIKFFTPNNDGNNDYWYLKGTNNQFQPNSFVNIFDRYGRLITQITPNTKWNGTINGTPLPSSDYWFRVILEDGREFKNHFALKR